MGNFYLRPNDKEECWELIERNAINDDGNMEDAIIARFYDGTMMTSPVGELVLTILRQSETEASLPVKTYSPQRDTRRPGKHWTPSAQLDITRSTTGKRRIPAHLATMQHKTQEQVEAEMVLQSAVKRVFEDAEKRGHEALRSNTV